MSHTGHHTASPLANSLNWLLTLHEGFQARTGPPPGEDWIAVPALMQPDSPHLDRLLALVGTTYATPDRQIWVSFFMNSYAWLVVAAGVGCYITSNRVPDLTPANLWLHFEANGRATGISFERGMFWALRDDPAAGHPDANTVQDRAALCDTLRRQLEAHMHLVIPVLRTKSSFGTRALWITAADRCARFLFWLHQQRPAVLGSDQLAREVEALIRMPGSPFYNPLTGIRTLSECADNSLAFQRGACCLNYKRPGGQYCASCPVTRPRDHSTAPD